MLNLNYIIIKLLYLKIKINKTNSISGIKGRSRSYSNAGTVVMVVR